MLGQRKHRSFVSAMSLVAVALAATPLGAKGWNPFAKAAPTSETVSSTARPKFDGERPEFGENESWSSIESPRPNVFSRVGQGTSRALSKTKDALTFRKDKSAPVTISKYPQHAAGLKSKPVSASSKPGMLRRWLKPSQPSRPSGPPATTNEFLSLERPKF